MNFNYSYRAFLITSLLTGILVLLLISIKLSSIPTVLPEETYDMVIAPEDLLEETDMASLVDKEVKIETNKAYNESEKFISSVENENRELTETTEGKMQEMQEAMENSAAGDVGNTPENNKAAQSKEKGFSNSDSDKDQKAVVSGGNRNTTISYRLVDRKDVKLPNPVYTCYGSGRVVINIEVDNNGFVKKGSFNKSASTTSNECLVDAAIEYSLMARFNNDETRKKQLGTISFNFPGQRE